MPQPILLASLAAAECVPTLLLLLPRTHRTHLSCRDDQLDRRMTLLWESNNSMSIDLCAHIAYAEEVGASACVEMQPGRLAEALRACGGGGL